MSNYPVDVTLNHQARIARLEQGQSDQDRRMSDIEKRMSDMEERLEERISSVEKKVDKIFYLALTTLATLLGGIITRKLF